jgi:hypothetical protein
LIKGFEFFFSLCMPFTYVSRFACHLLWPVVNFWCVCDDEYVVEGLNRTA